MQGTQVIFDLKCELGLKNLNKNHIKQLNKSSSVKT